MSSASVPKNDPTEVDNLVFTMGSASISDNDPTKVEDLPQGGRRRVTYMWADYDSDDFGEDDENDWSHEPAPLVLNHDALKHIGTHFVPGSHGPCVDVSVIRRNGSYEKRLLHFEDGWSCVGRFVRQSAPLAKYESELATMQYVRKHTTIPVPEVFYSDFSDNNTVGAPYVLQEFVEGKPLDCYWKSLSLEHKLDVTKQMAKIYGQLAGLKFDTIGSLTTSDGKVGPLLHNSEWDQPLSEQPLTNTLDFMKCFLKEDHHDRTEEARAYYPAIKEKVAAYLAKNADSPILNAPFRLYHRDLAIQEMIVTQDESGACTIRGMRDWDWAHTAPLYYLIDWPEHMLDFPGQEKRHADNKVVRKLFVRTIADCFPKGSADREAIKRCFREKNFVMDGFKDTFMWHSWTEEMEVQMVSEYRYDIDDFKDKPHGHEAWASDSELESDEDEES